LTICKNRPKLFPKTGEISHILKNIGSFSKIISPIAIFGAVTAFMRYLIICYGHATIIYPDRSFSIFAVRFYETEIFNHEFFLFCASFSCNTEHYEHNPDNHSLHTVFLKRRVAK
jgi:hypothetical protein